MKGLFKHTLFIATLLAPMIASAQMGLYDIPSAERNHYHQRISFADSIRLQSLSVDYFSPARYRHERRMIREERNTIQVVSAMSGSFTSLNESWRETSGGDNSVSLLATVAITHKFTKGNFSLDNYVSGKFGYNYVVLENTLDDGSTERDPVWYKNQDELQISVTPSYKLTDNWSYGMTLKFRTQFAKGYLSSSSQERYNLKSDFMSPGYLDISGGLIYNCPLEKFPIKITLSPLAMSATYVTSKTIRENAQYSYKDPESTTESYVEPYGVNPEYSSEYEGGSSIQFDLTRSFGKNDFITYKTSLFSFYGWMTQLAYDHTYSNTDEYEVALEEWNDNQEGLQPMLTILPTMRWENSISIKASKLLTTSFSFQLYYNRAQNYKIQSQTLLSVGLSYTFKNK